MKYVRDAVMLSEDVFTEKKIDEGRRGRKRLMTSYGSVHEVQAEVMVDKEQRRNL